MAFKLVRKRKSAPKRKLGMYRKKATAVRRTKYRDGQSVKLVHNDMRIINVDIADPPGSGPDYKPFASGSGWVSQFPADIQTNQYMNTFTCDFTGAFLFRLRNCLQWTQFNTLYDRVKLNGVKLQFFPSYNTANVSEATPGQLPTMKMVYDYDDANPPQSADAIWARQGTVRRLNKPFSIYVKPKVRTSVQAVTQGSTPVSIIAKSEAGGYLDTASASDVAHYGLKFAIKDWPNEVPVSIRVVATYYVTFRQLLWNAPTKTLETVNLEDVIQPEEETPCELQPEVTLKT